MNDVIDRHRARVRAADPLAAVAELSDDLIEIGNAVGAPSTATAVPGARSVHWGPPAIHTLRAAVAGDDPAGALGHLLDRWISALDAEPGSGLVVNWPSRDTAPVAALARRGFAPRSVLAVRVSSVGPAVRVSSDGPAVRVSSVGPAASRPALSVRPAVADDLDTMCRLYLDLIAYEAQFGWISVLPSTPAAARAELEEKLARGDGWCWLAEQDGEVAGMLSVHHPDHAGWVAPAVEASPVAYVGSLYARPGGRGRGIGAALAGHAHATVAAAGVETVLVHYAAQNPLSVPFWSRQGYRPLVTTWGRLQVRDAHCQR
ncbi:GNAT family N-acetyltransferase [Nonomuraea mesophila]|uniref:GNAT family N-acetyltransferase n=1 Tax=Nonomuraea mesophila TaxID=2530382 RepID=A0A4R5E7P0_9ACTN|nr:GNAT family N-acetyltransferase [Nonomuraea mesophila]TDE26885.1 GNAT family N-acetyltransferase [Nonomuraea mesophila]